MQDRLSHLSLTLIKVKDDVTTTKAFLFLGLQWLQSFQIKKRCVAPPSEVTEQSEGYERSSGEADSVVWEY